jgi:uncharacterized protein YegL
MYQPQSHRPQGEAPLKTLICLILDRSGSMGGREDDVIGGVNSFIAEQKKLPHPALISFVRFDSEAIERFRPVADLQACQPLTRDEFQPRGGTPLLDAVGVTIAKLDEDWQAAQPDRAIVVIVTDGHENASREYRKARVRKMIEERQASGRWSFLYFGANVDAFAEAGELGILGANSASYTSSRRGTGSLYSSLSRNVGEMRSSGSTRAPDLGRDIGEDEPPPK